MRISKRVLIVLALAALCLAQQCGTLLVPSALAAKSQANKAPPPVGYGGPHLRLLPMMVPYHSSAGVQYQPLLIEVELSGGGGDASLSEKGDMREKQACFILPLVHEKLLEYVFNANLVADDFTGDRRDVLASKMFDAVLAYVGKGYYTKLMLLNDDAPPLDPKSETLSKQCH